MLVEAVVFRGQEGERHVLGQIDQAHPVAVARAAGGDQLPRPVEELDPRRAVEGVELLTRRKVGHVVQEALLDIDRSGDAEHGHDQQQDRQRLPQPPPAPAALARRQDEGRLVGAGRLAAAASAPLASRRLLSPAEAVPQGLRLLGRGGGHGRRLRRARAAGLFVREAVGFDVPVVHVRGL